jgi:hypothetical protein
MTMRATGLISGLKCSSNSDCFGFVEYKGRREICASFCIVAPQTSKTRQHRRYHAPQQTNVRSKEAATQRWGAWPTAAIGRSLRSCAKGGIQSIAH